MRRSPVRRWTSAMPGVMVVTSAAVQSVQMMWAAWALVTTSSLSPSPNAPSGKGEGPVSTAIVPLPIAFRAGTVEAEAGAHRDGGTSAGGPTQ